MYRVIIILITFTYSKCLAEMVYEHDVNFRVNPGSKTCIYENGKAGQTLEVFYQVLDGQHGDLDISFDVTDPNAVKIVSDYKKPQNSIIMDLTVDGDYTFCFDNTYSMMNSKLIFVYILIENPVKAEAEGSDAEVAVVEADGKEKQEIEVLTWTGTDEQGKPYYLEVANIITSLSRTLKHVVKARHLVDIYGATKSRDGYLALEDTFIVDAWSALQISFMFIVGMVQVYVIKMLFKRPCDGYKNIY